MTHDMPKCWDSERDWHEWLRLDANDFASKRSDGFSCKDCTPEYKARMQEQDRCAMPQVVFRFVMPRQCKPNEKGDGLIPIPELRGVLPGTVTEDGKLIVRRKNGKDEPHAEKPRIPA